MTKHGGGSVMVWQCLDASGVGRLVIVDGALDQDDYVDTLARSIYPWIKARRPHDDDYVFQEDNAPCHTGTYAR